MVESFLASKFLPVSVNCCLESTTNRNLHCPLKTERSSFLTGLHRSDDETSTFLNPFYSGTKTSSHAVHCGEVSTVSHRSINPHMCMETAPIHALLSISHNCLILHNESKDMS